MVCECRCFEWNMASFLPAVLEKAVGNDSVNQLKGFLLFTYNLYFFLKKWKESK